MATIFLERDEFFPVFARADVFGRPAGQETVAIAANAENVTLDANVERIDIAKNSQNVVLRVTNQGLELRQADGPTVASIKSLNQNVDLRFADGNVSLRQSGATEFRVTGADGSEQAVDTQQSRDVGVPLGSNAARIGDGVPGSDGSESGDGDSGDNAPETGDGAPRDDGSETGDGNSGNDQPDNDDGDPGNDGSGDGDGNGDGDGDTPDGDESPDDDDDVNGEARTLRVDSFSDNRVRDAADAAVTIIDDVSIESTTSIEGFGSDDTLRFIGNGDLPNAESLEIKTGDTAIAFRTDTDGAAETSRIELVGLDTVPTETLLGVDSISAFNEIGALGDIVLDRNAPSDADGSDSGNTDGTDDDKTDGPGDDGADVAPEPGTVLVDGSTTQAIPADLDPSIARLDLRQPLGALRFDVTSEGLRIRGDDGPIATVGLPVRSLDVRLADGNLAVDQTDPQTVEVRNPTDPTDFSLIGAEPITPEIGLGPDVSAIAGGSGDAPADDANTMTISPSQSAVDASGGDMTFVVEKGEYPAQINNFAQGDTIQAFNDALVSIEQDAEQADGEQRLTFEHPETDANVAITLTGLTASQDETIVDADSFDTVFGENALERPTGNTDGGPDEGNDADDGSDSDDESDPDDGNGPATTTLAEDNAGAFDASAGDVRYRIEPGTYEVTIQGFAERDTLEAFADASVTVINPVPDDGKAAIEFARLDTGAAATVTVTGLSDNQDLGLFGAASIDQVFGPNTLVVAEGDTAGEQPDDGDGGTIGDGSENPGTTTVSAVTAGVFDAGSADVRYDIRSGDYAAEIQNFEAGDTLEVFNGADVVVRTDADQSDGEQRLDFVDDNTGDRARITLTGLSDQQDDNLFNPAAIDDTFGDDTLLLS